MKIVKGVALAMFTIVAACFIFVLIQTYDRHRGYSFDLRLPDPGKVPGQMKVGFASVRITPLLPDTWKDNDNNARFEPEKGDFFVDGNGNGKFDAIGFFIDDVITVRKLVAEKIPEIDHIIISSTHCHEVPDLIGLWGESDFKSGVNPEYRQLVHEIAVEAICAPMQTVSRQHWSLPR